MMFKGIGDSVDACVEMVVNAVLVEDVDVTEADVEVAVLVSEADAVDVLVPVEMVVNAVLVEDVDVTEADVDARVEELEVERYEVVRLAVVMVVLVRVVVVVDVVGPMTTLAVTGLLPTRWMYVRPLDWS
jgi:hypothetical protein